MENTAKILIVDDDRIVCQHLKAGLSDESYSVTTASKGADGIKEIKAQSFNLVLLDLVLPDIDGIDLMRSMKKHSPDTSFIIFTGNATISTAIEALKVGAYDYIIKPFDIDHLKLVIRRGLEKQGLVVKNKELLDRLEKEKMKLEIIMEAYNGIGGIFGLDDLADFVTSKALQIVDAEKASLMVVDKSANELVVKGLKGGPQRDKVAQRMKIGELIAGWVAEQGEALLVDDIDSDARFSLLRKRERYKTKSFISLPLKIDSQVIGVINVTDKLQDTKVFNRDDLRYLNLIAHQTVIQIENIKLCEKLASMAVTDSLTNIFNHRYFQEQLNIETLRAQRYKHPLSLIIFDIDMFKTYNDRYGHIEGDKVLKQVSFQIRKNVRQVDIVSRYGGDEFTVILPFTNVKGAKLVAEKVREAVETMEFEIRDTGKLVKVTLSGGVAGYHDHMTREEFIKAADRRLYDAKAAGKNKIFITD